MKYTQQSPLFIKGSNSIHNGNVNVSPTVNKSILPDIAEI